MEVITNPTPAIVAVHPAVAGAHAIPNVKVPVWAWALAAVAVTVMYFVMLENGAILGSAAETLHEFFHDGRHFSGVPCH